jgi:uncharacterized protein (DUF433 family)
MSEWKLFIDLEKPGFEGVAYCRGTEISAVKVFGFFIAGFSDEDVLLHIPSITSDHILAVRAYHEEIKKLDDLFDDDHAGACFN